MNYITVLYFCLTNAYGIACVTTEYPSASACIEAREVVRKETKYTMSYQFCVEKVTGKLK